MRQKCHRQTQLCPKNPTLIFLKTSAMGVLPPRLYETYCQAIAMSGSFFAHVSAKSSSITSHPPDPKRHLQGFSTLKKYWWGKGVTKFGGKIPLFWPPPLCLPGAGGIWISTVNGQQSMVICQRSTVIWWRTLVIYHGRGVIWRWRVV